MAAFPLAAHIPGRAGSDISKHRCYRTTQKPTNFHNNFVISAHIVQMLLTLFRVASAIILLLGFSSSYVQCYRHHPSMVDTKGRVNHSSRKAIPPCSSWKVDNENAFLGRTHDISRSRRDIFTAVITAAIPLLGTSLLPDGALAFDNRISTSYDDRPKRRGPQVIPFTSRITEDFHEVSLLCHIYRLSLSLPLLSFLLLSHKI